MEDRPIHQLGSRLGWGPEDEARIMVVQWMQTVEALLASVSVGRIPSLAVGRGLSVHDERY